VLVSRGNSVGIRGCGRTSIEKKWLLLMFRFLNKDQLAYVTHLFPNCRPHLYVHIHINIRSTHTYTFCVFVCRSICIYPTIYLPTNLSIFVYMCICVSTQIYIYMVMFMSVFIWQKCYVHEITNNQIVDHYHLYCYYHYHYCSYIITAITSSPT